MNITEEQVPHIWTSKGHLPEASLEHYVSFEDTEEYIKFRDVYMLNGEIVKDTSHVHIKKPLEIFSELPPEQGVQG